MSQSNSDDSRAVETRRRLRQGFEKAIGDRVPAITVVQLCKIAGVGRSTFYSHFATIDDLAAAVIGDLFVEVSPVDVERRTTHAMDRSEITRLGLGQLLETLWDSRELVAYAIRLPSGPAIQQRIISDLALASRPTIVAEQPHISEPDLRLASAYIAGGVIQLVLAWLDEPKTSRASITESLLSLLPSWMTGATPGTAAGTVDS